MNGISALLSTVAVIPPSGALSVPPLLVFGFEGESYLNHKPNPHFLLLPLRPELSQLCEGKKGWLLKVILWDFSFLYILFCEFPNHCVICILSFQNLLAPLHCCYCSPCYCWCFALYLYITKRSF